jgi:hypothetical protein
MEFHFVILTSIRKKINKLLDAKTKKEVKQKLISWAEKTIPQVITLEN